MDLNEYQKHAMRTAGDTRLEILGLGIAGEAGEVADEIKKHRGHGHPLDKKKIKKELGDTLWYLASIADEVGFTLEEVAQGNIDKLKARYPEGFSSERSLNRSDSE